jgi:hypothetical protein
MNNIINKSKGLRSYTLSVDQGFICFYLRCICVGSSFTRHPCPVLQLWTSSLHLRILTFNLRVSMEDVWASAWRGTRAAKAKNSRFSFSCIHLLGYLTNVYSLLVVCSGILALRLMEVAIEWWEDATNMDFRDSTEKAYSRQVLTDSSTGK